MRIALTARDYLPAQGGLQQSVHQLAHRLLERGHEVVVLAGLKDPRAPRTMIVRAIRKIGGRPMLVTDRQYGYPVVRAVDPVELLPQVGSRFRPDVVVVNIGGKTTFAFTRAVLSTMGGLPYVLYLRDVEAVGLIEEPMARPGDVVTNALRITELVAATGVTATTIPSVVETGAYLTDTTRSVVLYINPHARKGVEIAWALASAAPTIPFVFLETWRIDRRARAELQRRARALGNVELRPVQHDPKRIYADARILLAPYDDSRPRVVAEAQANGIPVLAAEVGGLVEGVGPGGLFVDPAAPIEVWAEALHRLWADPEVYGRCSDAAVAHAGREEMRPERLAAELEDVLTRVVARHQESRSPDPA